jgi:glycosyltransferase involved in cell wall biosynthesis
MFHGKTIHLTKTIGPDSYGVGQVALNLPKAQAEMGMGVELWSVDSESVAQDAALGVRLDKSVCRAFPQSWPGFLHYSREMEKEARLLRLDANQAIILHQHMIWLLYSRTALILRERGAKVVIAPHGALDDWALAKSSWKKKLAYRLWEGNNLHGAHCLQATSEREIQNFRDYGLKNPIARINNGVSQEQLESRGDGSRFRDRHGISQDRRLMLFIARISRQKGLPMLLSAMNALRSKLDGWVLVVGGSDQDGHEAEVKELVEKLGLGEHVVFVGPLFGEAKLDAFAASEVFVLPSHCEGSPMIVLEAMAGQLPVLCTKAASWGELETHGCGWWPDIEEGSVRHALEDILPKSTAELEQMGGRAHGLVAKEYSWKVAAERTAGLYAWLTGQGDRPQFVITD